MPRFVSPSTGDLVSTAYKVMYSTLKATSALREIDETEFADRAAEKLRHDGRLLMVVRNPYAKLASFFADKLCRDLEREEGNWQFSQMIFFPLVGVTADDSFETIRRKLRSISFEAFIDYLPSAKANGHLRPQSELLLTVGIDLAPHSDIFPIETDAQALWDHLGIVQPARKNVTFSRFDPAKISRQRLDLINTIYAGDFQAFGYEMR